MSRLYEESHRSLQDEFGTRKLADRVEEFVCVTEFSDDAKEFALRLLMTKAQDENGQKLFNLGEIDVLKHEVRDSDLQSLMLAVISEEEEENIDPKF